VVVALMLLAGVVALPSGGGSASASGLVVQWDESVPVGVEAFVEGVVPDGASGVRTEVLVGDEWVESEVGEIEADGTFRILLSFGADVVGVSTYRVVVDTVEGQVLSQEFSVTRTEATAADEPEASEPESDEPSEPEVSDGPEVSDEPGTSSLVAPVVEELVAETDPVTVSATNVPSKVVGALTRVWGRVSGHTGGEVFTEVLVGGEWIRSEATVSDATGYYQIPLTYGAAMPGVYTYRVGATTPDATVYSDTFTLTRTAPPVSVSAASAGSKRVGALTYVWGRVSGLTGGQVFTEVLVGGRWSRSQTVTSTGTGYYQIPLTYGSNTVGTYTWRVGAATPGGPVYSDTFTLTRTAPPVSVSAASAGSKRVGALTYVWGRVSGLTGGQVFTEVLVGGRWSRSQTVTSAATGYYQIPLTYGATTVGTLTWRVGAETPGGRVYSSTFTFTRTPAPRPPAGWNGRALNCGAQPSGQAVMVDKRTQRAWLCRNGAAVSGLLPFTSGPTYQAPRGVYRVYFKRNPWWSLGGLRLNNFTGFTRGVNGDRIGFHQYVIMPESLVGSEAYRNRSGGCFRMRARDAQLVYQFTDLGTAVHVLTNG
jgi:hypothetical protein